MSSAPAGATVKLYVDTRADIEPGHEIETSTTKRRYLVIHVRRQLGGKRRGRQHLCAIVLGADDERAPGTVVHVIHWYRRKRRGSLEVRG